MIARSLALCLALCLFSPVALSAAEPDNTTKVEQDKKEKKKEAKKKEKKRGKKKDAGVPPGVQAYLDLGKPDENHKRLLGSVGKWSVKSSFWMAPGAPPTVTEGTSVVRAILGGRYIQETYRCKFFGTNFQGIATVGYDKTKKKYVSTWIDNMGTSISMNQGSINDKGVTVMLGEVTDPASGETSKVKMTIDMTGKDTHVSESFHILPDGTEFKTMRLEYTRAKPKAKKAKAPKKAKAAAADKKSEN